MHARFAINKMKTTVCSTGGLTNTTDNVEMENIIAIGKGFGNGLWCFAWVFLERVEVSLMEGMGSQPGSVFCFDRWLCMCHDFVKDSVDISETEKWNNLLN